MVDKCIMLRICAALSAVDTTQTAQWYGLFLILLLLSCGDIHPNPGPNTGENNCCTKTLSVCHLNVNSLYVRSDSNPGYKLDEIYSSLCLADKYDVICISETWLNPSIPNSNVELPAYSLYRRDRSDGYGGVAVYVTKSIISIHVTELNSTVSENIWVRLKINLKNAYVGTFYRAPNSVALHVSDFIDDFQNQLGIVYSLKPDLLCIVGDFNDRRASWTPNHRNSDMKNIFYDTVMSNGLSQLISVPTYFTDTSSSLLDLVITDRTSLVQSSGVMSPIGLCHHCPVFCVFNLAYAVDKCYTRDIWLYDRAHFNDLNDYILDLPWQIILDSTTSLDDTVKHFTNILTDVCKHFIPNKSVLVRPNDKPWMTGTLRRLLRKRDRLHRVYRRTQNVIFLERWKVARRVVKAEIRKQKRIHSDNITTKLLNPSTPSKTFWKITKSLLGFNKKTEIPTLSDSYGNQYITAPDKAEHLAKYFACQSSLPLENVPLLPTFCYVTNSRLGRIIVTPEIVYKILCSLDINKAVGPDNISNHVLKKCALSLSDPLSEIFNQSLSEGVFPTEWKYANVSPLFKSNDSHIRENYRPISLLSCVSKCLECCVFMYLYKYCVANNLLTWRNSGFKHRDSTVYQLIGLVHMLHDSINKGKTVTMVFLDISKAFDKVWHEGLLFKLKTFGIEGSLLLWFRSYLDNRRQRVIIKGQASPWHDTNAGVPQGSILGPLLFLIFINDMENSVKSEIRMFADDTHIYDSSCDIESSIANINTDLLTLHS